MKARDRLILIIVVAFGFAMRAPITVVPLIIDQLARGLHASVSNLGILTTIPLVMFLSFSVVAAKEMTRFGLRKALNFGLAALLAGACLRLWISWPTILLGTVLVGLGITHVNVLTPSVVSSYEPQRVASYTTSYSTAICLGTAIMSLLAGPLNEHFGWQSVLWSLMIVCAIPFVLWLFAPKSDYELRLSKRAEKSPSVKKGKLTDLLKSRYTWAFLIMFGSQSIINYTLIAWLPVLMKYHGFAQGQISVVLSCYSFAGLPVSLFLPRFLDGAKERTQAAISWAISLIALAGAVLMFWQSQMPLAFWYYLSITAGALTAVFFIMALTLFPLKTTTPQKTAQLSGLTQSGGYFIAAFGPMLYGAAYKANPLGIGQNIAYVLMIALCLLSSLIVIKMPKI